MKNYTPLYVCLLIILLAIPAAGEGIRYDFDHIEVVFAAEFEAYPEAVEEGTWFADLAGGSHKPLHVLYGVVYLGIPETEDVITEEFIKLSGENGSERFLQNSFATAWYDTGTYTQTEFMKTFFWSAKKLEGNTVVKDFSPPIKSVILKKNFDLEQNLVTIDLFLSTDGEQAGQDFWSEEDPHLNVYRANMQTLLYYGDPRAGSGKEQL